MMNRQPIFFMFSDIAKIVNCPVIHVNGDHPEDVLRACQLAIDYRVKFQKDVLVDLIRCDTILVYYHNHSSCCGALINIMRIIIIITLITVIIPI
jgi:hypothetical protein